MVNLSRDPGRANELDQSARGAALFFADHLEEFAADVASQDPLGWPGYDEALREARLATGMQESVLTADGQVAGHDVVVISFDMRFLGGSMGAASGEKLVGAVERARRLRRPLVSLIATGGARMQEGMCSLVQMQAIAAAAARARRAGIPHVALLRDPTMGGVWASLANTADVIIALRGARIAFAGPRLRPLGPHAVRDPFDAAGKLATGAVDAEARPDGARALLERWVGLLQLALRTHPVACPPPTALGSAPAGDDAAASVAAARAAGRPDAEAYLDDYFDDWMPLSGDRCGGVDDGLLCGLGRRDGAAVAFAAQRGTATRPAGFRTVTRLLRLADRLQIPVLTLIDTPGAANDGAAERDGIGAAICEVFVTAAEIGVPITSVLIGEGGSGGALALAAPHRTWATQDSYFSVISPELAAEILHHDRSRAPELMEHLSLRPSDLARLSIVRRVLGANV